MVLLGVDLKCLFAETLAGGVPLVQHAVEGAEVHFPVVTTAPRRGVAFVLRQHHDM
ncbi:MULTISPECIES: hypothetical protein [Bradyrhizobium]|uniref:hypothetical protein n=1 Tax=Bradyrhizobium pachyrhizi TaxID=280333 RepID=UPI00041AB2E5